jgi:hypothetical protein
VFGVQFPPRDIAPLILSGVFCCPIRYAHMSVEGTTATGRSRDMTLIADERGCAEQLARFFPKLPAARIPVRVSPLRPAASMLEESTFLEFGSREYAIFLSTLPLEFDDRVRLVRDGAGRQMEAAVIALRYHEGQKAVAVRFLQGPCDWVMQS